jgi:hypothetical protein
MSDSQKWRSRGRQYHKIRCSKIEQNGNAPGAAHFQPAEAPFFTGILLWIDAVFCADSRQHLDPASAWGKVNISVSIPPVLSPVRPLPLMSLPGATQPATP